MQLKKKLSSYQKLKLEIKELSEKCNEYYEANYNARRAVGSREIYGGSNAMVGNEEMPIVRDPNELTKIILNLPV